MSPQASHHETAVKVTVIFPISTEGAFHAEEPRDTTAGTIRQAAMNHFKVADDGQYEYYLTHDGRRVPDESTVGDVAEHAEAVRFTLVKELVQGRA